MRRWMSIACLGACLGVAGSQIAQSPALPNAPSPVSKEERVKRGLPLDADITPPRVVFAGEPEFPEKARKYKGPYNIVVHIQIDKDGKVQEARVVNSVGHAFDEKALEAVRQYRFKPAMQDGSPIPWDMDVEINFQVF
jgi:TonB family protein